MRSCQLLCLRVQHYTYSRFRAAYRRVRTSSDEYVRDRAGMADMYEAGVANRYTASMAREREPGWLTYIKPGWLTDIQPGWLTQATEPG